MQQVVFRLLGPPEIFHKNQLIKIPRRRARALLYYLVCTQAPQPRERLLALLCGDVDEESARKTFKTLLAEVRGLLRGIDPNIEWIISDGDQLKLNPRAPLWLDTEIFEKGTSVTSHALSQTIELYRGNFLDGFFLKDAPDFDAWVRSARDHFHRLYLTTLRRLAELYESENQLEQAITCTQMLLANDPLLEEAYTRLMRLYWMTDKRVEAIRQYERLCAVLAKELAVKPSPSTQDLYDEIILQNSRPAASSSALQDSFFPAQAAPQENAALHPVSTPDLAPTPCVDRVMEMEWLNRHLTGNASHYPLLLLQGEAGAGKTALLRQVCSQIGASWLILQGACQEIEQIHAYHAIVEALQYGLARKDAGQVDIPGIWRAQVARLLPDLFPSSPPPGHTDLDPLLFSEALVALLNHLARPQRPLLLILDDLHWADTATLALLGHLASHVRRGNVFLLGTFCPALAEKRLDPLRRSTSRRDALAELVLTPLSIEELEQLASLMLASLPRFPIPVEERTTLAQWSYQRSEGNPLIASTWLALALKDPSLLHQPPGTFIPAPVRQLATRQLATISQEAYNLLTAAAMLGTSFDLLIAAQLVGFSAATTLAASNELLQKALILEAPGSGPGYCSFVHSAVRDVLLVQTGALQRHLLQRAVQSL